MSWVRFVGIRQTLQSFCTAGSAVMQSCTTEQTDDIQVAAAVLSKRYEDELLKQGSAHNRVLPALVITGFLGAGKTTLLQHLLASCGHELKLGVLVNEVAHLDVDSQLLNTSSSNAAAGIRAAHLAGGCACCSVSSDLHKALSDVVGSSNYQHLDYLLLETSGVADAEPLAASLGKSGFRLTGVVAVVDAEAGLELLQQDIAQAQLRAADIMVLNKCDLASLGQMSSVEDLVQQVAPGVRMLRARFGQVPAEALLDLEVRNYLDTPQPPEEHSGSGGVQGEIAFLSHEPVVSSTCVRSKQRLGTAVLRRRAHDNRASAKGHSLQTGHHHRTFGSVSFTCSEPLCMACFQSFVADQLVPAQGLFRVKGFAWFQQQRTDQYVFHLSGKQRVECGTEGGWQGPPGVQLVLIGQQQDLLQQLHNGLQGCVYSKCPCRCYDTQTAAAQQSDHSNAAAELVHLISQHAWLEVVDTQQEHSQLVQYTAKSSVLHGVLAEEVNAAVLRKVNTVPGIFRCHKKSHIVLQTATGQLAGCQGVTTILHCLQVTRDVSYVIEEWQRCAKAVAPVLRTAYQHVHNCKCDVALAVAEG